MSVDGGHSGHWPTNTRRVVGRCVGVGRGVCADRSVAREGETGHNSRRLRAGKRASRGRMLGGATLEAFGQQGRPLPIFIKFYLSTF
jgi:hypothetical protein